MDREQAFEALKLRVEKPENVMQSLAVEAVMRELAKNFHEDVEQWGIAGLVHNIDIERIKKNTGSGMMSEDILEGLDFDESIVYAVKSLNPQSGCPRRRRIDKALYCTVEICRLMIECANTLPGKNLKNIDRTLFFKYYHDKGFSPEVSRDVIASCAELELSLESFADLSIKAVREISGRLE